MITSCKIIEDLLPMYHDGICSDESAAMVDEHLKECPKCSQMLASLHGEIEVPKSKPEDLKPLEDIHTEWKNAKKRSAKKGACITLAIIVAVFVVWTCIWYFGYAVHYDKLSGALEQVTDQVAAMTTASHSLEYNEYMIVLKKPGFLGEGGFVHVGNKEGMVIFLDENLNEIGQNKEMWIDMFFYPEFGGGYRFALMLDDGKRSWWVWLTPELTYRYDLYDAANRPEEEIAYIEQLLSDYHDEVIGLFDVVKEVWGIEYLTIS